ncbi:hypothetical protein RHSIM_Rhsim11G0005500 [Rhododendron simsii]|uniref:Uncharacterized protein n=1 Tax=Rhododendron simsii TaxID=118357 RepID=A0A834G7S7_RHOSS|nr:hypothetical protein RHSIM_Rhsim11G0005500 [Rhododendron simsii]
MQRRTRARVRGNPEEQARADYKVAQVSGLLLRTPHGTPPPYAAKNTISIGTPSSSEEEGYMASHPDKAVLTRLKAARDNLVARQATPKRKKKDHSATVRTHFLTVQGHNLKAQALKLIQMNEELVREGRRFAREAKEAKEERDKALDEKRLAEEKRDTVVAKSLSLEEALVGRDNHLKTLLGRQIIPNQSCLGSTITLAHHEEATPAQIQLGDSGKDSLGVYSSPRDPGLDLAAAKDQEDEGKMGDLEEVE